MSAVAVRHEATHSGQAAATGEGGMRGARRDAAEGDESAGNRKGSKQGWSEKRG